MEVHAFAGAVGIERRIAGHHDSVIGSTNDRVVEEVEYAVLNNRAPHRVDSNVDSVHVAIRRRASELAVSHHQRIGRCPEVDHVIVASVVCAADSGDIDVIYFHSVVASAQLPKLPSVRKS